VNTENGQVALEANDVGFSYPDGARALVNVSLQIGSGEFIAMMGANGSGKTTLMKVLMRLLRPREGQVRLDRTDIADLSPAELYRQIGMVFQNPADQLLATTVRQDVALGPRNLGLSDAEVSARVDDALELVDATALANRPIHHLSYGQQKRICLAGVLAMRPSIMLLDEPTAGLDPVGETRMAEILLDLNRRRGVTLVVSTHGADLLPVLANRICILRQGRVWHEGPPREVFADPERAAKAGLRLPVVAQLFYEIDRASGMGPGGLPLTVAEAKERILQWLAGDATVDAGEDDPP